MRIPSILLLTILFFTVLSCGPGNGSTGAPSAAKPKVVRISELLEPSAPLSIPMGEDIPVVLAVPDTVTLDSIHVYLGGALLRNMEGTSLEMNQGKLEFVLPTEKEQTGKSGLRLRLYFSNGKSENQSQQLTFLSDVAPVEYTYEVLKEYKHDAAAYTQGLEYVDGVLYEGTGNYGSSSLRRAELESGEVLKQRDMDQSLFGEGITVLGERIYQITYKSQVGFIYDKNSFEEIQKIYYQNREGWGLTNNGKELIMSDGTHVIYFLDPEMFTINRQIEVYTNAGPATSLNELEYIDGKIWANRYFTDEIVIIDPESGKVEGRINLKGILKTTDRKPNTDVLNGIAWDSKGERLFVTGKRWPKLFEIRIRPLEK